MSEVFVGIDIGTTSIKALAIDSEGRVIAKAKRKTTLQSPEIQTLEHEALDSWYFGPLEIWEMIKQRLAEQKIPDSDIQGVCVAAMVPSLTAVNSEGKPISPGIIYGDKRGGASKETPMESEEFLNLLKWMVEKYPSAAGYWPAQTVANSALCNAPVLDIFTALTTMPLFSGSGWDKDICQNIGIKPDQLPDLKDPTEIIGEIDGVPLLAGTIDALSEMMVLPKLDHQDVIAIFGSTLICWTVSDSSEPTSQESVDKSGLWSLPHTQENMTLIGGPSNAGGLFIDKANELFGGNALDNQPYRNREELSGPEQIPVWLPYIKGERVPLHNPTLTASLLGLDLSHTNKEIMRAAYEASGFIVRRQLELAGTEPKHIIATGGGIQCQAWMEAVADVLNTDIQIVKTPEGAALGAAWLAGSVTSRQFEKKEPTNLNSISTTIKLDPNWAEFTDQRYQKFLTAHS